MNRAIDILRSGSWLTRERIRLVAAALLIASAAGFLFLVVTAHGGVDLQGRPLGTDFSNVYAAGTYVLDGNANAAFDPPQQYRPRAGDLRRCDPVLRLALPALFSVRRRGSGFDALRARAHGVARGHDGTLSVDDVGDFELVIPGPAKREPGIHIRRAPDKGTERRPSKIVVMDSGQPRSLSSGRPLRAGPVGGFRNDG